MSSPRFWSPGPYFPSRSCVRALDGAMCADEKRAIETRLREDTSSILQSIQQHLARWSRPHDGTASPLTLSSTSAVVASSSVAVVSPCATSVGVAMTAPISSTAAVGAANDAAAGVAPLPHATEWQADRNSSQSEVDDMQRSQHLLVSHLTAEIDQLGAQQEQFRYKCEEQQRHNEKLRAELLRLQAENSGLCHRVAREREIRSAAILDRARLETEIELDSERAFNSSSTRSSVTSSPALSSSQTTLPPTWHLPSPRGLTPSLLTTPSGLSSASQLSPRAPSPKTGLPSTPARESRDAGRESREPKGEGREREGGNSTPGTPHSLSAVH